MIFAVLIGLLTAAMLYALLFKDWDEFVECVKFCFTPEIISALRGKYWEDVWAETKILLWLGISVMAGVSAYFWLSVFLAQR